MQISPEITPTNCNSVNLFTGHHQMGGIFSFLRSDKSLPGGSQPQISGTRRPLLTHQEACIQLREGYTKLFLYSRMQISNFDGISAYTCPQIFWTPGWEVPIRNFDKTPTFQLHVAQTLLKLISVKVADVLGWSVYTRIPVPCEVAIELGTFCRIYGFTDQLRLGVANSRLPRTYIVIIRSSITIEEHLSDVDAAQILVPGTTQAKIHRGSLHRFSEIAEFPQFLKSLISGDTVYIAGYGISSAGAALLTALNVSPKVDLHLYTYAHGRLGNRHLMDAITSRPNSIHSWWSIQNEADPVTTIPGPIFVPSQKELCYYDVPPNRHFTNLQTGKGHQNHFIATYLTSLKVPYTIPYMWNSNSLTVPRV